MMTARPLNVLFLCTGNSARSIMAEALLNHLGGGRFRGHSAGSHPRGAIWPETVAALAARGVPTEGLHSKSWDEFAAPDAPAMDLVVTVCDAAAGEVCPIWPGAPMKRHWSLPDPASHPGPDAERRARFAEVRDLIEARLRTLIAEPAAA